MFGNIKTNLLIMYVYIWTISLALLIKWNFHLSLKGREQFARKEGKFFYKEHNLWNTQKLGLFSLYHTYENLKSKSYNLKL